MNEKTLDEMMETISDKDFCTVYRLLDCGYDLSYTLAKFEPITLPYLATAAKKPDMVQTLWTGAQMAMLRPHQAVPLRSLMQLNLKIFPLSVYFGAKVQRLH